MKKWSKTNLGDCCEIVSGSTPSTNVESFWNGNICWVTPKDLSHLNGAYISDTPRKLTQSGLDSCGAAILPSNSVLFSSRAPIGHVAINSVPMATNQGFKSFVPKDNKVYSKFLYHWLRKNRAYLEGLGNGATFKEVSKSTVSRVEISLPPLAEQKRIAEILDRTQSLISKRKEAIAKLETLTQSIFIEIFGDPVANSKGWIKLPFGEVCATRLGKMLDKNKQTGEHRRLYLRNANVQWFRFDLNDVFEMNFNDSELNILRLKYGDLLICEGGESGRTAIWRDEFTECYYQKTLHRARPKSDLANPEYLARLFWFLAHYGGLSDHITSATIAHLTGEKLKLILIPVPPLPLQKEFAQRVEAVEKLKATHRASLSELQALFASLQHRAFRGEL